MKKKAYVIEIDGNVEVVLSCPIIDARRHGELSLPDVNVARASDAEVAWYLRGSVRTRLEEV